MASITDLNSNTTGVNSRTIINQNFDNLNDDKAELSGATFTGKVQFSGDDHVGVRLNNLTTAERDLLTPANGDIIYNTSTGQVEAYENGSWVGTTAGVSDASLTVKGVAEAGTTAEIDADDATGTTGANIFVRPDQLAASKYGTQLPSSGQKAALAGTSGTPGDSNRYVTDDDTANDATADAVARYDANGDMIVPASPTAANAATSQAYVNALSRQTIDINTTNTDAGNSGETTLYSFSVPANTLAANKGLMLKMFIREIDPDNDSGDFTLRLKYGSTTIASLVINDPSSTVSNATGLVDASVICTATGAQSGYVSFVGSYSSSFSTNATGIFLYGDGTATEDETTTLTFSVTGQYDSAGSPANKFERSLTILDLIQE